MKDLKVRQKYSAARRIFSTPRSDNETLRHMLDTRILPQGIQCNRMQVQINQPV